jgi:hypothetical protein
LTDIIPRAKVERSGVGIILNPSPPEPSNYGGDLVNEGFGKKNSGHVVNWNGSEHGPDVGEAASVVQFICLDCSEFGAEFVDNESIGSGTVTVIENKRVAKVNSIRIEVLNWEHILDILLSCTVHMFAE